MYTVSEGEEGEATSVSVCVAVIMSDTFVLTDAVYLNYSLSSQPNTASREYTIEINMGTEEPRV